ncbi:YfhO family protein [bacterium]|nr:YfhO family protein [bacterium]
MYRRLFPAFLLFAAYGLALWFPALCGRQAFFLHDVSIAYLPLRTAAADALRQGHLPLWDSRLGNGFAVLAEGQAGVFYPPHWLTYLGVPQYHLYALLIWLHCVLAACFMALFCRLWRLRPMPCLTAGMIYGFSGFFITHLMHITIVEAAAWLPLALVGAECWLRSPRSLGWLALCAFALGVQELVAMPQVFFYSVLTVILYFLVAAVHRAAPEPQPASPTPTACTSRPRGRVILLGLTGALLAAVLLSSVQVLPTLGLMRQSSRTTVTAEKLRELALTPRNLAYFVHPYVFGSYAEGNYFGRDHYYEVCGFAGTLALLFGLLGAWFARGRARAFALVLVPLSLFLALANQNPLYELFPHLPGFSWFRGAGRYVLLTTLGLAILAAYGIHMVGESRRVQRGAMMLGVLGLLLALTVPVGLRAARPLIVPRLARMVAADQPDESLRHQEAEEKWRFFADRLSPSDPNYLMLCLCLGLVAVACGIVQAPQQPGRLGLRDARWIGELALALTVVQLFVFARDYNPTIDTSYYTSSPRLAEALKATPTDCLYMHDQDEVQQSLTGNRGWLGTDKAFYWEERETLRPNRQVLYGLRSANVFYALVPDRYWTLERVLKASLKGKPDAETGLQIAQPLQVLSALGARVVVTSRPELLPQLPVLEDHQTWLARGNSDPAPVAYFAQGAVLCPEASAALRRMCDAGFTWRRPVVESTETIGEVSGEGPARLASLTNDCGHMTIECETASRRLLVVRETYDPHFVCRVDGRVQPLLRANYLFRGVLLEPGRHRVEFSYDARDLHLGMVLSGLAFIALLGVAWAFRRGARSTL